MSVTEMTVFRLRDANTFNPMAVLELLRQMVITYSHVAESRFTAYQEKEEYSRFYIIGEWRSIESQQAYSTSDLHTKIHQLIESTLELISTEIIDVTLAQIMAARKPFLAVGRYDVSKTDDFNDTISAVMESEKDNPIIGGYLQGTDTFIFFAGCSSVKEQPMIFDQIPESLQSMVREFAVRHIELNQFI